MGRIREVSGRKGNGVELGRPFRRDAVVKVRGRVGNSP
jgi:hypothetical protein